MYTEFYGLDEKPFALVPDPRFLYLGSSHREALAHLLYGIEEGEGFIEVVGQVGTGKTTLCRTLLERVGSGVEIAFIFNPSHSEAELLASINREFGLPTAARSRGELIDELNQFLLQRKASGRRALLVIDEAQTLEAEVLEQIRLLSNLETEREKLLQIVLIGQPELEETLARTDLRQLRQRITVRWSLRAFSRQETREYMLHRLRVAGHEGVDLFSREAFRVIHRRSRGIPRVINAIADRALLVGYGRGRPWVDARIARAAAREVVALGQGTLWAGFELSARTVATLLVVGVSGGLLASGWLPLDRDLPLEQNAKSRALIPVSATLEPRRGLPAFVGFRDQLLTQTSSASAAAALDALLDRWGYPTLVAREIDPNLFASAVRQVSSLKVFVTRASLPQISSLNLPAIVELDPGDGQLRYAALLRLEVDGMLRMALRELIFPLAVPEFRRLWTGRTFFLWSNFESVPALAPGMNGSAVRWLQARLTDLGYLGAGDASGQFDEHTTKAIRRFQKERALVDSGEVGAETLIALYQALDYGAPRLVPDGGLS